MITEEKQKTQCAHCGEHCEEPFLWEDHHFCCQGCQTVYEILDAHALGIYYEMENTPGIRRKYQAEKYDYLDHEEIKKRLLEFQDNQRAKVTLFIPVIHCSSCIYLLENLHRLHEGIVHAQVFFLKKEISIVFQPEKMSLKTLVALLAMLGYEPEIVLGSNTKQA